VSKRSAQRAKGVRKPSTPDPRELDVTTGGILHPFTRALYERIDAERVRVTLGAQSGVFRPDGSWIEGELREADPQLCGWLGGPRLVHHRLQVPAHE
jgi:hypothetical protein